MRTEKLLFREGVKSSLITIALLSLSLLFINLQIYCLGIKLYGLLVLLLSLFGTINFINLGLGSALVSYYTNSREDRSIFWSMFFASFMFFLFLSLTIIIIISFQYKYIFNFLGIKEYPLNLYAFYGLGLIGISKLLMTIASSYWQAKVDFVKLKFYSFLNVYLPITIIIVLYTFKKNLNLSLFFAGISNILFIIAMVIYIFFRNKQIFKIKINRSLMKVFLKAGFQFQGIAIIDAFSNPVLNLLINKNFGLNYVSYFDIALKLLRAMRQIIVAASEPFFGKLTELNNKNKKLLMKLIVIKYSKIITIISILFLSFTVIFSKEILNLWVGEDLSNNTYIIVNIISTGFALNIASSVIYNYFLVSSYGRKHLFIHQLILLAMLFVIYFLHVTNVKYFCWLLAFSYSVSALYLFFVFKHFINKKI